MENSIIFFFFETVPNGVITLHDLVEIDSKNLSQSAMLQFLRVACILNSQKFITYKLWLSFARLKLVL